MEVQKLTVKTRSAVGKGAGRALRRDGAIPIVMYGGDGDSVNLQADAMDLYHTLHGKAGEHAIVEVTVEDHPDWNTHAMVQAVQHDAVRGDVLHADFIRIRLDQQIHTVVPIEVVGQAKGVQEGGVLDQVLREVEVECRPLEIPEFLMINVEALEIGDSLRVENLTPPENVTILTEQDYTIVAVHAPQAIEAPVEEEEALEGEEGEEEAEAAAEGEEEEGGEEKKEE